MRRGPRWTLRLGALALGATPFLHMFIVEGLAGGLRPFADLRVLGNLFERASFAWFLCWILPLAASLPAMRGDVATTALSLVSYGALTLSQFGPWGEPPMNWVMNLGALFLIGLVLFRVEAEIVGVWARVAIAATLLSACVAEAFDDPAPSVGLIGVAAGALLWGGAELALLRGGVPEDPDDDDQ